MALIGQEKGFKIQFLTNEKVTSQHTYGIEKSANKTKLITNNTDIIKTEMRLQYDFYIYHFNCKIKPPTTAHFKFRIKQTSGTWANI